MKLRVSIVGFVLAALALVVPRAPAQDGLRGAFSQLEQAQRNLPGLSGALAPADFDNDSRPDGAVLSRAGWLNGQRLFRIDLHVTARNDVSISFRSAEPELEISAIDINRDGAPDIVVEKPFSHQLVEVFLNNGDGVFQRAEIGSFYLQDDSAPGWRERLGPLYLPIAILPSMRGFELPAHASRAIAQEDDPEAGHFWRAVPVAHSAARAPSGPRAPPSLPQL